MLTTEIIASAAAIAGLFHDFGKANILFQNKLNPDKNKKKGQKNYEPYRHEWVSLRLFQAFVSDKTDKEWLEYLANISKNDEVKILNNLIKDINKEINNAVANLPPFAKLIGWLVVSHHRLPVYPAKSNNPPSYEDIDNWINNFDVLWNSSNHHHEWGQKTLNDNWNFSEYGTPINSQKWCDKAQELANKALNCPKLLDQDWLNQRFIAHISRLCLMLADHYYSAGDKVTEWQDKSYKVYANTYTDKNHENYKEYKQQLDEHNIGVGQNACSFARKLPSLKNSLPTLADNKILKKELSDSHSSFNWQNKAYKLAQSLASDSQDYGFFGINMASTGKGKTLGNARIMSALSNNNCRFSVALGLRTLTLQTGQAFVKDLKLDKQDLATLIGSIAVRQLHDINNQEDEEKQDDISGSNSSKPVTPNEWQIDYEPKIDNKILTKWLKKDPKAQKLIYAPVLVSTIDHLIPATEGTRGGQQITPMLRLLTSDLVLDEPDDFGLEDLPALCRLVNWAGMLGSRVLLSTATMPPALAYALFQSYQAGREHYTQVNGEKNKTSKIVCAWFDETQKPTSNNINNFQDFKTQHSNFVKTRIKKLNDKTKPALCKGALLPVDCNIDEALNTMSETIHEGIHQLHNSNNQEEEDKIISIGLVRMANINPLVAVAKKLFSYSPQENYRIHYCIYHGRFPLAVRSYIENRLDWILNRKIKIKDKDEKKRKKVWQEYINDKISNSDCKNHIFVVLASPVAEVGRDHDYDWAIAEPSSMRSIIQLAGRIQRHRKIPPKDENMLILSKNFKALQNKTVAYEKPGFETKNRLLCSHEVSGILKSKNYEKINSIPRIDFNMEEIFKNGDDKYMDFVLLEHYALLEQLLGFDNFQNNALLWWNKNASWCGEIQKNQKFRASIPDNVFYLYQHNDNSPLKWKEKNKYTDDEYTNKIINKNDDFSMCDRNNYWFCLSIENIYQELVTKKRPIEVVSERFGELRLGETTSENPWYWRSQLGVYKNWSK